MNYDELKTGDSLVPIEGEKHRWRAVQVVLGLRPMNNGIVVLTVLSLADASVREVAFDRGTPLNSFYELVRP